MTFEELTNKLLIENGLSAPQAKAVLSKAKDRPCLVDFKNRWGDSTDNYPPVMVSVLWVGVKLTALEWIDEHEPHAWFRPLFEVGGES